MNFLQGMSGNTKGALIMMVSMAGFVSNDTCMKLMAGEVPLYQLLLLRGILATALLVVIAAILGQLTFRMSGRDALLILLRSLAEVGAAYFFLTALFNMPLPNVTAILKSIPLVLSLAAWAFFNEPLGWRRMSAILIGLVGVIVIINPTGDGFNIYSVYALAALGFVVVRDLTTRKLTGAVPSIMVTIATSFAVMVAFGVASAWQDWVVMTPRQTGLTVASALFVCLGYLTSVMVMRVGDISFVAPFRYTGLVWALILGWLVFGFWPSTQTLIGAGIVVGSGLFMLWRERKLSRKPLAGTTRAAAAPRG